MRYFHYDFDCRHIFTFPKICDIIMKQLSYQRSNRALGFAAQFGLFLWSSGCSRRTIDALHRCGLSVSYPSVLNNIAALARARHGLPAGFLYV